MKATRTTFFSTAALLFFLTLTPTVLAQPGGFPGSGRPMGPPPEGSRNSSTMSEREPYRRQRQQMEAAEKAQQVRQKKTVREGDVFKVVGTLQDSVSGEASKGFDFLRSTIRVFGSYSLSESERLISQSLYQYHAQGLSFGGSLSFSPLEWIGIVYSSGFAQSRSYTEGRREQATTVRSNTQRLSMSVYPTKTLTLTLAAADNYNNLTAENRHAWFGDATAKLKLKHIDLELQLNNLFDQRQYTRVNYSGLDIYTQTSQLRPRNIIGTIRFKLL